MLSQARAATLPSGSTPIFSAFAIGTAARQSHCPWHCVAHDQPLPIRCWWQLTAPASDRRQDLLPRPVVRSGGGTEGSCRQYGQDQGMLVTNRIPRKATNHATLLCCR